MAPGGAATQSPLQAASQASAFVLAQLYQTLVRVTCDGITEPELAARWSSGTDGTEWRFLLRPDVRMSNGASAVAEDVQESWSALSRAGAAVQAGRFPLLSSVFITGEHALTVALQDAESSVPMLFAHPAMGVWGDVGTEGWPLGSGQYMVRAASNADETILQPVDPRMIPMVIARRDSTKDGRDLLDSGVDILQTRDPAALEYARRGGFGVYQLPFDRTYVIAVPEAGATDTLSLSDMVDSVGAHSFRTSLARDAVRGDARGATGPSWWGRERALGCSQLTPAAALAPERGTGPSLRLMYEAGDPVARALSERLVAIARGGGAAPSDPSVLAVRQLLRGLGSREGQTLTAAPTSAAQLRAGNEFAYVIQVPHRTVSRCMELRRLMSRTPWLSPSRMFPLIDTRPSLVTRSGVPAVSIDFVGTLRIHPQMRNQHQ
jgi:hypothetical protein